MLKQELIIDVANAKAGVVNNSDHAPMRLLDKVTYYFIVKVVNVRPVDVLSLVLFLLLFQHKLNEQLLQLFVAVVDTELLEAVRLEHFKAVDVQHTNDGPFTGAHSALDVQDLVDSREDKREQLLVHGLGESVSGVASLY